jgi:hypothetical protein
MLVPRFAQDAHPLQRGAQFGTGLVLFRRQPIGERAIGIAQPEALDQLTNPIGPQWATKAAPRLSCLEQKMFILDPHVQRHRRHMPALVKVLRLPLAAPPRHRE